MPAARVRHNCEGTSTSFPNQGQFAGFKVKKGKERGPCLVNDLFMEPRKLFSSKMIFFLGSNPSIFFQPGNICFSRPCIFQWFSLLHDTEFTSIYIAKISARLSRLREFCHSKLQNQCFVLLEDLSRFPSRGRTSPPQEEAVSRAMGNHGICSW